MENLELNIVQIEDSNIDDFVIVINNVASWLDENNLYLEGWSSEELTKEKLLSRLQKEGMNIGYVGYIDNLPVCTMILQDYDFEFWGENSRNENAIYIHRVAVLRKFAGKGFSYELLNFAKEIAIENSKTKLRLDCKNRPKLRKVYEDYGFKFAGFGTYSNALYELDINNK